MPSREPTDTIPVEALLADAPPALAALAETLRTIVLDAVPDAIERVRPGWRLIGYDFPLRRHGAFFAWVWPEAEHVHLGFPRGVDMEDPDGRAERRRRHEARPLADLRAGRHRRSRGGRRGSWPRRPAWRSFPARRADRRADRGGGGSRAFAPTVPLREGPLGP